MVAAVPPNDECRARDPPARVGRRPGGDPGPARPRLRPGLPGIHAGRADRGSATAAAPRLELRSGGRRLRRHVARGRSHHLRGRGDVGDYVDQARLDTVPKIVEIDSMNLDAELGPSIETADVPSIAYLQYSSGSTRLPTGVMISHRNLQVNFEQLMRIYFADSTIKSTPDHVRVVVALLPRHGLGTGRLRADPGRLSRRADQPDRVPGKAGQMDAGAGRESACIFGGAQLRLRPGRPQDHRR